MTTRRTHRVPPRSASERRVRALVARVAVAAGVALLLGAVACVHGRSVGDPVPGGVERAEPDSVSAVLDAANSALVDEGLGVGTIDRKRSFVESPWIDVSVLHVHTNLDQYESSPRVRFRFRAFHMLGGTRLMGEAVYQPLPEAGRATEQMVPGGHPAREVLNRMLADIDAKLRDRRTR